MGNGLKCPKSGEKMVYPLLPKCSNFQITEFSPALETNFESIFVSGGYNQGGCGLDHFASEPFILCQCRRAYGLNTYLAIALHSQGIYIHVIYSCLCEVVQTRSVGI